jgi:hypothetical protein
MPVVSELESRLGWVFRWDRREPTELSVTEPAEDGQRLVRYADAEIGMLIT